MTERQDLKRSKLWWDFMSTHAASDPEVRLQTERCIDAQTKLNKRLIELAAEHTEYHLEVERSTVRESNSSFLQQGVAILHHHSQANLAVSFHDDASKAGFEVIQIVGISE